MSYRVNLSPEFQRDLDDIWNHMVEEYMNPDAAERITDGILDTTQGLENYPLSGRKIFLPGGFDSGYRFLVFEDYVIVYRIQPDAVQVARVVHSAMDYMRVMFPWLRKKSYDDEE